MGWLLAPRREVAAADSQRRTSAATTRLFLAARSSKRLPPEPRSLTVGLEIGSKYRPPTKNGPRRQRLRSRRRLQGLCRLAVLTTTPPSGQSLRRSQWTAEAMKYQIVERVGSFYVERVGLIQQFRITSAFDSGGLRDRNWRKEVGKRLFRSQLLHEFQFCRRPLAR